MFSKDEGSTRGCQTPMQSYGEHIELKEPMEFAKLVKASSFNFESARFRTGICDSERRSASLADVGCQTPVLAPRPFHITTSPPPERVCDTSSQRAHEASSQERIDFMMKADVCMMEPSASTSHCKSSHSRPVSNQSEPLTFTTANQSEPLTFTTANQSEPLQFTRPVCFLRIGGLMGPALVDTGAVVSCVSQQLFKLMMAETPNPFATASLQISADDPKLTSASGHSLDIVGSVVLTVCPVNDVGPAVAHKFYIVDRFSEEFDVLVGVDLLSKLGPMVCNFETKSVNF